MVHHAGQGTKTSLQNNLAFISIIKGLAVSYIITIPLFIIFAFVMTYVDFPERHTVTAAVVATIAGAMSAGIIATKGVKSRGWFNGGIVGLIYILVLYIISSIVYMNFSVDWDFAVIVFISVLSGIIGGITGVNMRERS